MGVIYGDTQAIYGDTMVHLWDTHGAATQMLDCGPHPAQHIKYIDICAIYNTIYEVSVTAIADRITVANAGHHITRVFGGPQPTSRVCLTGPSPHHACV